MVTDSEFSCLFFGCAHRHEIGENIIISPEKSSPGFNPVELKDSRWEVFMSMHGAYCNNIKIELEIEAE